LQSLATSSPILSSSYVIMMMQEELYKDKVGRRNGVGVHASYIAVGTFFLLFCLLSIRIVPPSHVGLSVTLGSVSQATLSSGLHICNPLSSIALFSTKVRLLEQRNHVPTKEGLTVDLDVAILYHVEPERVREIFLALGEDFENVIIQPELSSAVRGLTSEADAKALYTSGRSEIQRKLKAELKAVLEPRGIGLEDVLLKAIVLPEQLTHSIELKAQAEQEAARMEFILVKERQEAERKTIEAKGVADFQKIVSEGISPALLQWKGIEATEMLSRSPNSKIVIMGNSKESLPVILGGDVSSESTGTQLDGATSKSGNLRLANKGV